MDESNCPVFEKYSDEQLKMTNTMYLKSTEYYKKTKNSYSISTCWGD